MGGFSLIHWIIVLLVVVLIFGTKKLPGIGKDLGDAMRGFKKSLNGEDDSAPPAPPPPPAPVDPNLRDETRKD